MRLRVKDVCRNPYGLRRIVKQHRRESGFVVYGWFNRLRGWPAHGAWGAVLVRVDGHDHCVLHQLERGPVWIPVDPGAHVVEFLGGGEPLRVEHAVVDEGHAVLFAFKPQEKVPFRRPTPEKWCVRTLWGG